MSERGAEREREERRRERKTGGVTMGEVKAVEKEPEK